MLWHVLLVSVLTGFHCIGNTCTHLKIKAASPLLTNHLVFEHYKSLLLQFDPSVKQRELDRNPQTNQVFKHRTVLQQSLWDPGTQLLLSGNAKILVFFNTNNTLSKSYTGSEHWVPFNFPWSTALKHKSGKELPFFSNELFFKSHLFLFFRGGSIQRK